MRMIEGILFGEVVLWCAASLILWIVAVFFIYKSTKIDKEARPFIYGIAIFTMSFGIARMIETIRKYSIGSYYDVIESGFNITGVNLWLRIAYYIIAWAGITVLYYSFEKYVMNKKTKYILTIFSILEAILASALYFTSRNSWIFLFAVLNFLVIGLFPIALFLYLSYKSLYKSTRIAWIIITIGFIFFALGMMGDLPEAWFFIYKLDQYIIRYFTPLAQIAGVILMAIGFSTIYK